MASIEAASLSQLFSLFGQIKRSLEDSPSCEAAMRHCIDRLYARFESDLVLARAYLTVPYFALPRENQHFVDNLARNKGISLRPDVPVLSLLSTRGRREVWNDPRKSVGHRGIPLCSVEFVDALPMIARLLADFGIDLGWVVRPERSITTTRSGWAGLFHVPDARTARDQNERLIIPAQDFVAAEDVRTVFGVGGSYENGTLIALISFSRREISREIAQRFLPLTMLLKLTTSTHLQAGRIFTQ